MDRCSNDDICAVLVRFMDDGLFLPFSLFRYSGSELRLTGRSRNNPTCMPILQGIPEGILGRRTEFRLKETWLDECRMSQSEPE
jgi:hypothetical protein